MMRLWSWRGFTLLEMMIVVGLSSLLYSLLCYVSVQMNVSVRRTEDGFKSQKAVINIAERIRWQLRCLYDRVPDGAAQEPPPTNVRPATLKNRSIYGKRNSTADGSILLFKTNYFTKDRDKVGVAEVGYAIKNITSGVDTTPLESVGGKKFIDDALGDEEINGGVLVYRQFAWADPLGLHEESDFKEAPWTVISKDIANMKIEFSEDNEIWQQEWTKEGVAPWVRVSLESRRGTPIVFIVSPAVGSGRW